MRCRGGDKDDLKAIVLDMRNNGGGLLQGAVETANLLLPPGTGQERSGHCDIQ